MCFLNMEAFVEHSASVHLLSRDTRGSRGKPLISSQSGCNYGRALQTTFLQRGVSPASAFLCPHQTLLSTPVQKLGPLELQASATNQNGKNDFGQDDPVVQKRARRWWNFGQPENELDEGPTKEQVQRIAGTELLEQKNENEVADRADSQEQNTTQITRLHGETSERERPKEQEISEETKKGLLNNLVANILEANRRKEVSADRPKLTKNDDSWTEKFLDIIIPKRNTSKENAKPLEHEAFRESSEADGQKEQENRKIESPLDGLRGIQELYQPPPKKGEEKTKEGKQVEKGNLFSKLIPWLGQKRNTDQTSGKSHTQSSTRNGESGTEDEVFSERKETAEKSESKAVDLPHKSSGSAAGEDQEKSDSEESSRKVKAATNVPSEKSATATGTSGRKEKVGSTTGGTTAVEVTSVPQKDVAAIRLIFGSETFFATETVSHPGGLIFRGNLRGEPKATLAKLEKRLAARLGDKYTLCLAEGEEDLRPVVVVVPTARDRRPASPRQKLIALAIGVLTLTTCFARGAYANLNAGVIRSAYGLPTDPTLLETLFQQAPISCMGISIAVVILFSQVVQRIVAARRKTRIALPYLIPSYQLGSFGAVVQLASPTPSRAALFDIAFSGALTLLLVSLVLLVLGLKMSTSFPSVIPVSMSMVSSSMVIGALTTQVPQGQILVDYAKSWIGLHPLAVIGANCLTIAALNLLPIRQLDGGRIVSAIYGRKTAVVASRVTIFFLLLASAKVPYLFVFLAAVTFGPWSLDRPAKNELTEPNGIRAVLGYILLLAMVGILLPHPASKFFGTA